MEDSSLESSTPTQMTLPANDDDLKFPNNADMTGDVDPLKSTPTSLEQANNLEPTDADHTHHDDLQTQTQTPDVVNPEKISESPAPSLRCDPTSDTQGVLQIPQLRYAEALVNDINLPVPPKCSCASTPDPRKALILPQQRTTFGSLARSLLRYGIVEGLNYNTSTNSFTVLFQCGCQASKAKNATGTTHTPFTPPSNLIMDYNPQKNCRGYPGGLNKTGATPKTTNITPPRFFIITPKRNPGIIDILAYLYDEVGDLPSNCLSRTNSGYILHVETDLQSHLVSMLDCSRSPVLQKVAPHPVLNSSRAYSRSKDLHSTSEENIKLYASPPVQSVYQLKNGGTTTILSFSSSQPPSSINILGLKFPIEPCKDKPRQCQSCFSYRHPSTSCKQSPRCSRCSKLKNEHSESPCQADPFCLLCKGKHNVTSRDCPIYKFEESLLNEARKRGCGRGHIRAERRAAAREANRRNNQSSQPSAVAPTPVVTSGTELMKDTTSMPCNSQTSKSSPISDGWNEVKRRKRKGTSKQPHSYSQPLPSPLEPYFQLPEAITKTQENDTTPTSHTQQQDTKCTPDVQSKMHQTQINKNDANLVPAEIMHEVQSNQSKVIKTPVRSLSASLDINPQEPPPKKGRSASTPEPVESEPSKPTETPKKRKKHKCPHCKTWYREKACLEDHDRFFHPSKEPQGEPVPNRPATIAPKDHKCGVLSHEKCTTLFVVRRKDQPHLKSYVDSKGTQYSSVSLFREGSGRAKGSRGAAGLNRIYGPSTTPSEEHIAPQLTIHAETWSGFPSFVAKEQQTQSQSPLQHPGVRGNKKDYNPTYRDRSRSPVTQGRGRSHSTSSRVSILKDSEGLNPVPRGPKVREMIEEFSGRKTPAVFHPIRPEKISPVTPGISTSVEYHVSPRDPRLQLQQNKTTIEKPNTAEDTSDFADLPTSGMTIPTIVSSKRP